MNRKFRSNTLLLYASYYCITLNTLGAVFVNSRQPDVVRLLLSRQFDVVAILSYIFHTDSRAGFPFAVRAVQLLPSLCLDTVCLPVLLLPDCHLHNSIPQYYG